MTKNKTDLQNEKLKKKFYLVLTTILVFLLAFIFYALMERVYIQRSVASGSFFADVYRFGFLWQIVPLWLKSVLLLLGIVDGYFLGQYWWRVVYIEKRHWRFRKK
jgi:hypothetical protein